jgi:hypothetical protein
MQEVPKMPKLTQGQYIAFRWIASQKVIRMSHRPNRLSKVFDSLVELGLIQKHKEPVAMDRLVYTWPTMVKCPDCREMQPGPKIKVWIHGRCVKAPQIQNLLKAVERLEASY